MPARPPVSAAATSSRLADFGKRIRAHRKALGINATAVAEASGMSRVTLHRIEKGEPAVTIGAYLNALSALGLDVGLIEPGDAADGTGKAKVDKGVDRTQWIPVRIRIADYPQLERLAWQLHGADSLTPIEALNVYERNWRHVDERALLDHERQLIDALRMGLSGHAARV